MRLRPSALTGARGKRGRQSRDAERRTEGTFTLYAGPFLRDWKRAAVGLLWWGGDRGRKNATDGVGRDRRGSQGLDWCSPDKPNRSPDRAEPVPTERPGRGASEGGWGSGGSVTSNGRRAPPERTILWREPLPYRPRPDRAERGGRDEASEEKGRAEPARAGSQAGTPPPALAASQHSTLLT